jgi:HPt (histidine-containing phosphotransfer) domain-containing protein
MDKDNENNISVHDINIAEIDAELGCSLYDYEMDIYISVLRSFVNNVQLPINKLKNFSEEELKEYTIAAHSLKSSFAIIGAERMRIRALELETKSKEGDIEGILKLNGGFIKDTEVLANDISAWLKNK